jgi:AraC-like DNA-binding protein
MLSGEDLLIIQHWQRLSIRRGAKIWASAKTAAHAQYEPTEEHRRVSAGAEARQPVDAVGHVNDTTYTRVTGKVHREFFSAGSGSRTSACSDPSRARPRLDGCRTSKVCRGVTQRLRITLQSVARRGAARLCRSLGLQLAARLLDTTDDSVLQVALAVGYESEAAFNRAFKREFELPPARYRRQRLERRLATASRTR